MDKITSLSLYVYTPSATHCLPAETISELLASLVTCTHRFIPHD